MSILPSLPDTVRDLTPTGGLSGELLFTVQTLDGAIGAIREGYLPPFGRSLTDLQAIGVRRWAEVKAARPMPPPYRGVVGDYVDLALTPRTRAAFGSSRPGTEGAIHRRREDLAIACVVHASVVPMVPVYVDRSPMRKNAVISGDPRTLDQASWERIRRHAIGSGSDGDDALQRYDASVLVWQGVPLTAIAAIACCGSAAADRLRSVAESAGVTVVERDDYFW